MNTKKLTLTIVFAALTVALNPAISRIGVPAPYLPFLIYGLWEIPIAVAFLLIGPKSGSAIMIINAVMLFAFFPGALLMGPFYNLAAIAAMLSGVYLAQKLSTKGLFKNKHMALVATVGTSIGIIFRIIIMSLVNYATLRLESPFGFSSPESYIVGILPLLALFNGTVVLYTIPIAYTIVKTIQKNTHLNL
jgi:riboflavin transporter FmnP